MDHLDGGQTITLPPTSKNLSFQNSLERIPGCEEH